MTVSISRSLVKVICCLFYEVIIRMEKLKMRIFKDKLILFAFIVLFVNVLMEGDLFAIEFEDIISKGNSLKFYGFIRLDVIYDNSKTDNAQIPFHVLSEDVSAGGKQDDAVYTMHPRLSRLGIDLKGSEMPYLFNGKVTGKFEMDFQNRVPGVSDPNSGVESRAFPRIRHMFLKLNWDNFFVLGGQNWDIISPLMPSVSNDTLMWNAGNTGDRRPQLRIGYETKELSLVGGAALTNAVDRKDIDANSIRDGEDSAVPHLQGRVGYAFAAPWTGDKKTGIGFWGAYLWEEANTKGTYIGNIMGADFTLPVTEKFALRGEVWSGQNLSDLRGGIGQGVNTTTKKEIKSYGGWIEMLYSLPTNSIAVGYTVDDPDDNDLPSSNTIASSGTTADGRTKNQTYYIAERFKPGGGVEIGIDYMYWQTDYKTLKNGIDNRINMVFQYNF